MAKKIKDIGLGSKPKQPTRKEVFETAYPTFKGNDGLNTKKVVMANGSIIEGNPHSKDAGRGFKKIWDDAEAIPRQRFENRIKKNKKTQK